jgi:inhibitor of cysteine peptidase
MTPRSCAILVLLTCLFGCAGDRPGDSRSAPLTLTLLAEDSGKTLELMAGERVQLQLAENPSTGFQWALDLQDRQLSLEASDFTLDAGGQPGSWGMRTFRFRVLEPGEARLRLKYWRQWEGERSVVNRFAILFRIRPPAR